jgi:hypothetical protein
MRPPITNRQRRVSERRFPMTESKVVQRLSRTARHLGLKLSTRQYPVRTYRLTEHQTGVLVLNSERLEDLERYLTEANSVSSIYADYYLRL